jgi:hypothetical protein
MKPGKNKTWLRIIAKLFSRLKPLPASPCQGRSEFVSPPVKGELEGVWF